MHVQVLYEREEEGNIDILLDCDGFIHYKITYEMDSPDDFALGENIIEVYMSGKKIDENHLDSILKHILHFTSLKTYKIVIYILHFVEIESLLMTFIYILNKFQSSNFSLQKEKETTILKDKKIIYSTNIPIKNFLL